MTKESRQELFTKIVRIAADYEPQDQLNVLCNIIGNLCAQADQVELALELVKATITKHCELTQKILNGEKDA